jgi:glycine cleavage system H protein
MEAFYYTNIFETKGIEYLVTVAFFLLLVPFWMILNKKSKISQKFHEALSVLSVKRLNIPSGVYHSPNHMWMYMFKSGKARFGLDELMLRITGLVSVEPIKHAGDDVEKGDLIAIIHQKEKQIKVFSPLSGSIRKFNSELQNDTSSMMEDTYGKGWMYEIKPKNWISETADCVIAEDAISWTSSELVRFKDFLMSSLWKNSASQMAQTLQDGGELREHLLTELPQEVWADFENEFLGRPFMKIEA